VEVPAIVRGSRVPAENADKVPAKAGRGSTVQADLMRGKREEEGSPNNREVQTRRMETGSQFFECRPYRCCNSGDSAIPESRATRATTSPIVRPLRPPVDGGRRVAARAKRQARRVARCGVKGRNINASLLNEDERNQKGIHNPQEGRPKARESGRRCRRDRPLSSCHRRGRSEAEDTLMMIFHGLEISIAGGGADEKDEGNRGLFFFSFFFPFFFLILYISF